MNEEHVIEFRTFKNIQRTDMRARTSNKKINIEKMNRHKRTNVHGNIIYVEYVHACCAHMHNYVI